MSDRQKSATLSAVVEPNGNVECPYLEDLKVHSFRRSALDTSEVSFA